ncbi:MAG TPA: hypothetical protein VD694_07030 [Nitrososphaeraceae archaeon]|nr:hypothetical protein [Nitrososphaeraceae archaeon]
MNRRFAGNSLFAVFASGASAADIIDQGRKIYANIVEDNYCSNIRIFDIFYLFSID